MSLIDEIKNNATKNGTKIQTSEDAKLEKELNKLFYLQKNIEEETKFVKQVMTRGQDGQERVGLHASSFIVSEKEFCVREQVLALMYRQLQGEQLNVGLMRIFEEGNAIHEKWQRLFIRGGFSKAKDLDFTRYNEKYHISFTPDIICEIDGFGKMVGEIKSVNTFQFKKISEHPSGKKQLQWYMYLTGIHKGFTLMDDKNSQEFKVKIYDYDPSKVEEYIDRAEDVMLRYDRLLKDKKMVKRPSHCTSPDCKRCEGCAMKDACWNIGIGRVKL